MSVTYTHALLCNQNLIHLYLKQGERDIKVLFTGCPLGGQNDPVLISSVKVSAIFVFLSLYIFAMKRKFTVMVINFTSINKTNNNLSS